MRQLALFILTAIILVSCSDKKRKPSIVFMPDMYYPVAYEPYEKATFGYPEDEDNSMVGVFSNNHNMTALKPVEGTVPQTESGLLPYALPNTNEGYNASKKLQNPLYKNATVTMQSDSTFVVTGVDPKEVDKNIARGEKLYNQTCVACHGPKGDGQGSIVLSGAYSGVPNYKDRDITVGTVHHVIMYGKNAMGSYASQLNAEDRWRVAEYVMQLRNNK